MGEVYVAQSLQSGKLVAIKVLKSDVKSKYSAIARFRREARAVSMIESNYVAKVLDVGDDLEFGIFIVSELLRGESLIDSLKRKGPMPFDELHPIICQVWQGLVDAHRVGIIHRDLKPSNIYLEALDKGTRVKILDFGISKIPKDLEEETLTEIGQSLGTFSFMPPEQIGRAKFVDPRADIYSCSTLIYQALSGKLPFDAHNALVVAEMKSNQDPRPLSEAMDCKVDPELNQFLMKGLARDPDQRFSTALEALDEWKYLQRKPMILSSPSSIVYAPILMQNSEAITIIEDDQPTTPSRSVQDIEKNQFPELVKISKQNEMSPLRLQTKTQPYLKPLPERIFLASDHNVEQKASENSRIIQENVSNRIRPKIFGLDKVIISIWIVIFAIILGVLMFGMPVLKLMLK